MRQATAFFDKIVVFQSIKPNNEPVNKYNSLRIITIYDGLIIPLT